MVAEAWIFRMGNQVSSNLKHALFIDPAKKKNVRTEKQTIGILSFEVANTMSKIIYLYKSLSNQEIFRLKNEIVKSEGVNYLISDDESFLLELACGEKLDDLNRVAAVVSRLGKKCSEPALVGFEHVYSDLLKNRIDVRDLEFLVKDMDGMIRKMERYVNSTSNLYSELEVLNELEQAAKKFPQNQLDNGFLTENRRAFEQKIVWLRQDVKNLRDVSLWNQTYDKIVVLLARTVCTIFARICFVFGFSVLGLSRGSFPDENAQISGQIVVYRSPVPSGSLCSDGSGSIGFNKSGPFESVPLDERPTSGRPGPNLQERRSSEPFRSGELGPSLPERRSSEPFRSGELGLGSFRNENFSIPCGSSPGRLFMECFSLNNSTSSKPDGADVEKESRHSRHHKNHSSSTSSCSNGSNGSKKEHPSGGWNRIEIDILCGVEQNKSQPVLGCSRFSLSSNLQFGPKCRLMNAPPSTVGGSALALHYANVIIVVEKLLHYPHLVGDEARDDLYQMLPMSLRTSLRTNLKSYVKNLASAIYDAPLAHEWKETLNRILRWLAPLAHNMIRWQTEHNFEQPQFVTRTNVLLLQTLYFADREKTEAAICELLVGLNYICRYEHQQNALMDCTSSQDFDEYLEWQLQY